MSKEWKLLPGVITEVRPDPMRVPTVEELLCEAQVYLPTESGANMYWEYSKDKVKVLAERLHAALARCAELERDRERLLRIGKILPMMLDAMEWGAFKGALLEDGDIRAAIDAARGAATEEKS